MEERGWGRRFNNVSYGEPPPGGLTSYSFPFTIEGLLPGLLSHNRFYARKAKYVYPFTVSQRGTKPKASFFFAAASAIFALQFVRNFCASLLPLVIFGFNCCPFGSQYIPATL